MLFVAFFPLFLLHHVQKISQLALADSGAGFVKCIDLWKYLPPIETTGLSLKSDMCFSKFFCVVQRLPAAAQKSQVSPCSWYSQGK